MAVARPGSLKQRAITMRVKAFADCILKARTPPIEMEHSRFVRAEAAFSLAKWQIEHAPNVIKC
jgi:hypothetical protein